MEWVKLTEISNPKQWKTISKNQLIESGYPVYGANGKIGFYNKYNHEDPTILITCRGATCGTLNISEPYSYINGNAMSIDDLNVEKVNIMYLYYFLKYRGFNDVISGSAQPQITRTNLEKILIPLFENKLQLKIVKSLEKIEDIIKKRKEQIQAYDDLIESLFFEMFNSLNTSDISLKKLIKFSKNSIYDFTDYLDENYIGVQDIEKESGKILKIEKVSNSNIKSSKNYFTKDDVLYSRIRPNLNKVALPNFNGLVSSEVFVINCSDKINKYFLAYTLRSKKFVSYAMLNSSGANFPRVNKKTIEDYKVKVPPIELQNKFADYVIKIEEEKKKLNSSLKKLEDLFDALMQDAFSGNLFKDWEGR